jgi:hypothetical protein
MNSIVESLRGIVSGSLLISAAAKMLRGYSRSFFLPQWLFWMSCALEGAFACLLLSKRWVGAAYWLLVGVGIAVGLSIWMGDVPCGCLAGVWNDTISIRLTLLGLLGALVAVMLRLQRRQLILRDLRGEI